MKTERAGTRSERRAKRISEREEKRLDEGALIVDLRVDPCGMDAIKPVKFSMLDYRSNARFL